MINSTSKCDYKHDIVISAHNQFFQYLALLDIDIDIDKLYLSKRSYKNRHYCPWTGCQKKE